MTNSVMIILYILLFIIFINCFLLDDIVVETIFFLLTQVAYPANHKADTHFICQRFQPTSCAGIKDKCISIYKQSTCW